MNSFGNIEEESITAKARRVVAYCTLLSAIGICASLIIGLKSTAGPGRTLFTEMVLLAIAGLGILLAESGSRRLSLLLGFISLLVNLAILTAPLPLPMLAGFMRVSPQTSLSFASLSIGIIILSLASRDIFLSLIGTAAASVGAAIALAVLWGYTFSIEQLTSWGGGLMMSEQIATLCFLINGVNAAEGFRRLRVAAVKPSIFALPMVVGSVVFFVVVCLAILIAAPASDASSSINSLRLHVQAVTFAGALCGALSIFWWLLYRVRCQSQLIEYLQESLAGNEENITRFSTALNAASENIFIVDRHERILFMNKTMRRTMGLVDNESIGDLYVESILSEESTVLLRRDGLEMARSGRPWKGELEFIPLKGGVSKGELRVIGIRNEGNRGLFFVCFFPAENPKTLKSSESELQVMLDSAPVSLFITKPDGSMVYINKPLGDKAGISRAQIGKEGLKAILLVEDAENWQQDLKDIVRNGQPRERLVKMRNKNGQLERCRLMGAPITTEGGINFGVIGVLMDFAANEEVSSVLEVWKTVAGICVDEDSCIGWLHITSTDDVIPFGSRTNKDEGLLAHLSISPHGWLDSVSESDLPVVRKKLSLIGDTKRCDLSYRVKEEFGGGVRSHTAVQMPYQNDSTVVVHLVRMEVDSVPREPKESERGAVFERFYTILAQNVFEPARSLQKISRVISRHAVGKVSNEVDGELHSLIERAERVMMLTREILTLAQARSHKVVNTALEVETLCEMVFRHGRYDKLGVELKSNSSGTVVSDRRLLMLLIDGIYNFAALRKSPANPVSVGIELNEYNGVKSLRFILDGIVLPPGDASRLLPQIGEEIFFANDMPSLAIVEAVSDKLNSRVSVETKGLSTLTVSLFLPTVVIQDSSTSKPATPESSVVQ